MTSAAVLVLMGLLAAAPTAAPPFPTRSDALLTIEGTVARVGETAGEGELQLVSLDVQTGDGPVRILVAPPEALAGIGFEVQAGDRVRARVFLDPASQVAYAQKILNQSRDLMIRLRTLRQEPLWDAAGNWQGSPAEIRRSEGSPTRRDRARRGQRQPPPPQRPRGDG
jgi:hypothetical protein